MAHPAQRLNLPCFLAVSAWLVTGQGVWANESGKADANRKTISAAAKETAASPEKPVTKTIETGIAGNFLSARFARQNKDLKQSAAFANASLARDADNVRLRQETLRLNVLAGNMDTALTLAKKMAKSGENDPLIASLLMLDSLQQNDYATARKTIANAPDTGLFGLIKPVILQWLAMGVNDQKAPVSLQAAIDKSGFFAPFLTYHSALMNDLNEQYSDAELAYIKATSDPSTTPYRVIQAYANYYQRRGKNAEAQQLFDSYAKANPNSALLPGKITAGPAPKPMVANPRDGVAEVFFTTASLLFSDDSAQDTFLYLRVALALRPNLAPGQMMLANLYEQVGDYAQAVKTYDAIEPESVFARRAQVRKALNYEALGEKNRALELLDTVAKKYPEDDTALITKGDLLREQKDYAAAAEAYSQAITRSEPLKGSDWPLLYARGVSFERAGEWPAAEKDFERAISLEPNQPDVLNYLGYTWLTMNKNVGKAREYLEIAAASRPNDPHILDSVAWARYMGGDFKGAVELFERAIQLLPDDVTINDHLGDAYWRVGRQVEARFQWERALAAKPDKETEQSLRAKLEKGLSPFVQQGPSATAQQSKTITPPTQLQ